MQRFTTRPELSGDFGMVASTHWLASAAGMAILEKGGNAFDAACAMGFALQVVEPHMNGLGGEVPIIVAPKDGEPKVICGQGVAPALATLDAYRARDLAVVPGSGLLSAVVPGAFDAWMLLLRDYGSMRLEDVLDHAIQFAHRGCPLVAPICDTIRSVEALLRDEWPSSAEIYLAGGSVPAPGALFENRALAATYVRIAAEAKGGTREAEIERARAIWSEGFVAEAIDRFFRDAEVMDTTGRRNKGLLRGDDLAAWRATMEEPLRRDYHNHTVLKTDAWGQGPAFLQQLALLDGFDLDVMDEDDPAFVHVVTESAKLAFADREAFYGDPGVVDPPTATLLSEAYADRRRPLIGESASLALRPGSIDGVAQWPLPDRRKGETAEGRNMAGAGEPTRASFDDPASLGPTSFGGVKGDTCHLDVVDRFGNMVSATPSGGWLQSSPVVPGLGFCLTNRAQMFWLDPASPACLAPKKRPRTTLSPNIALKDGEAWLAFGTPGGDQQDQWSLHFFLRCVHFGLNLQEAIDAPAFHTDHLLSSFYPRETDLGHLAVESRFSARTLDDLRRRGHRLVVEAPWSLGRMAAVAREGRLLKAAANPRRMQGYAIGR